MKKIFVIIFLGLINSNVSAQVLAEAFVYSITGKSEVIHNSKTYKLKANKVIYRNDSIKVTKGSRLTLLNHDTKYIDVLKAGTYSFTELENKIGRPSGISKKMFHLLVEEFAHAEKISLTSATIIGKKILGVRRGQEECESLRFPYDLYNTIDDTITFTWYSIPSATTYEFNLLKEGNKPMNKIVTKDTFVIMTKLSLLKGDQTSFSWNVNPGPDKCTPQNFHFTVYSDKKEKELTDEIIKKIVPDKNDVLYNLRVSQVLAEQLWLNRSVEYYLKALSVLKKSQL